MALSNSYDFKLTATQVVQEMLENIGEYSPGDTIDSNDFNSCIRSLNMMIKTWQAQGIGLWQLKECALFFEEDGYKYDLGPSGDHATASYVKTEVATAGSSSDTSIVIDSTTGMNDSYDRNGIITATTPAASGQITMDGALLDGTVCVLPSWRNILIYSDGNDSGVTFTVAGTNSLDETVTEVITGPNATSVYSTYKYKTVTSVSISGAGTGNIEVGCVGDRVGIELDDDSLQWTFIAGALNTTLPLMDALTDDAAVDNHIYSYQDLISRPLEIVEARLHKKDDIEIPLFPLSRDEYMLLSTKSSSGTPSQFYYNPQRPNGEVRIWQASSNVNEWMMFTAKLPIQDLDETTDDFEFPAEWFEALCYNGAIRVAPKFGLTVSDDVRALAMGSFQVLKEHDIEHESIYFRVG